ncbi:hypothetical protein SeLEV6574_g04889 [Synchytrium endobioticum]|uniref:Lysosomal dipeptide transporter MFSD1 n=1 Tax=Synchytrium endobioticum TaxID=286115 RepID=A0A507CXW4_9FUNG|nr:hypothetical protein SeLEV6574_g04889 [Synchytrium endobioticum]
MPTQHTLRGVLNDCWTKHHTDFEMPASPTFKHYLCLLFVCLLLAGNYYCYDTPSALNVPLREWLGSDYDTYQWQINLLYSVYSLPNIFLPIVGGLLIDRLGSTLMLLVFSSCVCAGQFIFSSGIAGRDFSAMLVGRVLFGLGGESLEVAQARITTDWFSSNLAFAFSLNLSSARVFTALNDNLSPWISTNFGTPMAGWVGLLVTFVSFGSGLAVIYLDRAASREAAGVILSSESSKSKHIIRRNGSSRSENYGNVTQENRPLCELESSPSTPCNLVPSPTTNQDADDMRDDTSESFDEQDETVHCSQVGGFNSQFWILCILCITLYGSAVPFFHICTDLFQSKWYPNDAQKAGLVMSIPDIVSAIGSPIAGWMLDYVGHRATVLPLSGIMLIITHSLFAFTMVSPMFSMVLMGISYSVFAAALWPCIPFLVARHQVATAYGIVTVSLNLSLFFFPLVVAHIRTLDSSSFVNVEIFFIALSSVSVIVGLLLCLLDYRNGGGVLNGSSFKSYGRANDSGGEGRGLLDSEEGEVDGDEEVTAKVVGEGRLVTVPATIVHHHHHHHRDEALHHSNHITESPQRCNCYLRQNDLSLPFQTT